MKKQQKEQSQEQQHEPFEMLKEKIFAFMDKKQLTLESQYFLLKNMEEIVYDEIMEAVEGSEDAPEEPEDEFAEEPEDDGEDEEDEPEEEEPDVAEDDDEPTEPIKPVPSAKPSAATAQFKSLIKKPKVSIKPQVQLPPELN